MDVQDDGASEAFARKSAAIYEAIFAKLGEAMELLGDRIRGKLSGEVLQVRSGKLLGSVHVIPPTASGDTLTAAVEAGGPQAPYARTHEWGGRGPYEIVPVNKKALAFLGTGGGGLSKANALGEMVIVKRVHHPALAERSFFRTSFDEMRAEIIAMLEGAGGRDVQVG